MSEVKDVDSKNLISVLKAGSQILYTKMDAIEYKNYLLGILFYKYLSDNYLVKAYDLLNDKIPESMSDALAAYKDGWDGADHDDLEAELKQEFRFTLTPELTYTKIADDAAQNRFQRETLQKAFNNIEQSDSQFTGLFDAVDLYSRSLGSNDTQQSNTVSELVKTINRADLSNHGGDVLGDAYEYMLGEFASSTVKKAGQFYTPRNPGMLAAKIAMAGQEKKKGLSVYDACMGSGSLLLHCKQLSKNPEYIKYCGQEIIPTTFNLARMNMFLHNVAPENQKLHIGDTLDADWPTDEENTFDCVIMNPPYSSPWSASQGFLTDSRFSGYGVLPPKSKADYAFLLHGYYHLRASGTMAIFLPHGVLFRGSSEGKIREKLLESGAIYAVIGLAPNLFYNTSIPVSIIVLKKDRKDRDVLFIDASKIYQSGKKQNTLDDTDVDKIFNIYSDRKDVDKIAHLASFDEIQKNDFNLNIPRYVDSAEEEQEIDIDQVYANLQKDDQEIAKANEELNKAFEELGLKVRLRMNRN
jgi:type I restriction system adenine methylase (hsdM)